MSIKVSANGKRSGCSRCVRRMRSAVVLSDDGAYIDINGACLDILCPSCASRLAMEIIVAAEKAAEMDGDYD